MELTSVLGVCIIAALLCIVLSQHKPEYSAAVVLLAGAYIFLLLMKNIIPAATGLLSVIDAAGVENDYMKTALKALGICYITQFAADVCRDFGQTALASKAELAGKCAIFLLSLPLVTNIVEIAVNMIGGI